MGNMTKETGVVEINEEMAEFPEEYLPEESSCGGKRKRNDRGVAVVEVILILVVLIALVIIFRDQITSLVNTIWKSINGDANTLL